MFYFFLYILLGGGGVDGNPLAGCSGVVISTSNTSLLIRQPASGCDQTNTHSKSEGKAAALTTTA